MDCSTSIAKIILFIFNVCFFLFGVASLALGIWVVVGKDELFRFINLIDAEVSQGSSQEQINNLANQSGLIMASAYVLIGIGVFTLIVGFCGCCGALKESPMLLNIYAVLIALVLIIEITAAVLAGLFRGRIVGDSKNAMLKLQDRFFESLPAYIQNQTTGKAAITYMINVMQISLECCGIKEVRDIVNSSSWKNSSKTLDGKQLKLPVTCCRFRDDGAKKEAMKPSFNWTNAVSMLKDPNCPFEESNTNAFNQACGEGVKDRVGRYALVIIAVCIGIALVELLGIVFACCLIRSLGESV